MTKDNVPTTAVVRLNGDSRDAVAEIAAALKSPRRPNVTVSDVVRAAIGELQAAVRAERGTGAPRATT